MQIGLIGASGNIGARIIGEGIARGHRFTAFSRTRRDGNEHVTWRQVDVLDSMNLARELAALDVLVSAFGPGSAARDPADAVTQSIRSPELFAQAARSILSAMETRPSVRLIVVGGAGSLEVAPGRQFVDEPGAADALTAWYGLPADYIIAVRGHRDALNVYRLSDRLWTYFCPAASIYPGERTGRFRLGGDQLVTDVEGKSRISYEDYAVALIDEVELPRHVQRRFTIGY